MKAQPKGGQQETMGPEAGAAATEEIRPRSLSEGSHTSDTSDSGAKEVVYATVEEIPDLRNFHSKIRWGRDGFYTILDNTPHLLCMADPQTGNNALHIAVQNDQTEFTKYILGFVPRAAWVPLCIAACLWTTVVMGPSVSR